MSLENNVVISNQADFNYKLSYLRKGGLDALHMVSDFDRTVTRRFVNGKKVASQLV